MRKAQLSTLLFLAAIFLELSVPAGATCLPAGYEMSGALAGISSESLKASLTDGTIYGQGGTPMPGLVTWSTGGEAFECGNDASTAAAPEPPSSFLLASSLLAIGAGAFRYRRRTARVTAQDIVATRPTLFVKY